MLARVYLPQLLTALFGGIFVACGMLSFGNAYIFDRLFIGIIIFTAAVCYRNINIVSVLAIILLQRCIEEFAWFSLSNAFVIKEFLYCLALALAIYLRFDPFAKFVGLTLVFVIGAEFYWYMADYIAPEIYWHVALMMINLFSRYLVFSRLDIVDRLFPGRGRSTNLDWIIYRLMGTTIIIQCAVLIEYLMRHLLGYSNVLIIYYSYPYLMHAIGMFAIWATFNESYKQLLPRLLKA
ncbi:hypothetical protein [Flavobacterium sp. W21_SRS_FM6]|uniref:hypothetical protein n=1 Tax=Flavobacterium sp. W21_SRS_FM6 TaxID=3240268 RepID=UPI003F900C0B